MSYDAHWALRIKPVNDPEFSYIDYLARLYRMLGENGVNADVITLGQDLSAYKALLLPACFILPPEQRERLKAFVREGGTLLATFLTGVKNRDNVGYTDPLPAGLTDLFGVTVAEVEPVQDKNHASLALTVGGKTFETTDRYWSELLELTDGAEAVGVYTDTYKQGACVVSRKRYGKGAAYYLGAGLSDDAVKALLKSVCDEAAIPRHPFTCDPKVEIVRRAQGERELFFVFNFTARETVIRFDGVMKDLLSASGESDSGSIVHQATLTSETAVMVYTLADAEGFSVQIYEGDTIYVSRRNEFADMDVKLTNLHQVVAEDFKSMAQSGPLKLLIPGDPMILKPLEEILKNYLGEKATIFTSKPYFLEVLPANCHKGSALAKVAELVHVSRESVIAIGDSMNDEAMIRWAGVGVCMQNGDEQIKTIADIITRKTNDDDGVAAFIEEYLLPPDGILEQRKRGLTHE
jgi:Cof subfamily protein (haloacid dehalogenase superfamily)